MRRIQLFLVTGISLLALAMLGTSCGQGNETAAQRPLPKGTAVVAASYTVGGTVTGLSGNQMLLWNNTPGTDGLNLFADGPFTFALALVDGSTYAVTVATRTTITCAVANGSGTISGANVTDVTVTCTPAPITCGGYFSGSCVVDDLTGLLTGECWSVETCMIAPSCFCPVGVPSYPLSGTFCGPTVDSSWCSI